MSQAEKLLQKLIAQPPPKDLTWNQLKKVMEANGFRLLKNSGSRRKFVHQETHRVIIIHEPHPQPTLKPYAIKRVVETLEEMGIGK